MPRHTSENEIALRIHQLRSTDRPGHENPFETRHEGLKPCGWKFDSVDTLGAFVGGHPGDPLCTCRGLAKLVMGIDE